jgi:hypothetical protein
MKPRDRCSATDRAGVLYVFDVVAGAEMTAWRPHVNGIEEVFHARFVDDAYPQHTHDAWTLLIVDTGTIRYGLDRHEHGTTSRDVTLLPPHVPHDGRTVTAAGFRKRVENSCRFVGRWWTSRFCQRCR